jgi:hypothetical protein
VLQVQVRNFTTLVYSVLAFAEVCWNGGGCGKIS